jgi:hypothetical protein
LPRPTEAAPLRAPREAGDVGALRSPSLTISSTLRLGNTAGEGSAEAGVPAAGAEIASDAVGQRDATAVDLLEISGLEGQQGFPAQLEILLSSQDLPFS